MRECGNNHAKGMVSDSESVRSLGGREMLRSISNRICVCGGGGGGWGSGVGGGVDGSNGSD